MYVWGLMGIQTVEGVLVAPHAQTYIARPDKLWLQALGPGQNCSLRHCNQPDSAEWDTMKSIQHDLPGCSVSSRGRWCLTEAYGP